MSETYSVIAFEELKDGQPVLAFANHVLRWDFDSMGNPAYAVIPQEQEAEIERLTADLTAARELANDCAAAEQVMQERIASLEAERDELRDALEEIHRIPLAPETRPDMPYSVIARIDSIAIVALAKGGETEESA